MMERSVLLLLITGCLAGEDLGGKVFLFPKETKTAHVILKPNLKEPLQQASVCLRSYSSLTRGHVLFSMAAPGKDNILLMLSTPPTQWDIWVNQEENKITTDPETQSWKHSCVTWDSTTGVVQFWINGKPYPRRVVTKGTTIGSETNIVLGQEQDSYGGGFDADQSFVGEISDVHMWDYVLTPEDLQKVIYGDHQGNIINWNSLHYEIKGEVLVEPQITLWLSY